MRNCSVLFFAILICCLSSCTDYSVFIPEECYSDDKLYKDDMGRFYRCNEYNQWAWIDSPKCDPHNDSVSERYINEKNGCMRQTCDISSYAWKNDEEPSANSCKLENGKYMPGDCVNGSVTCNDGALSVCALGRWMEVSPALATCACEVSECQVIEESSRTGYFCGKNKVWETCPNSASCTKEHQCGVCRNGEIDRELQKRCEDGLWVNCDAEACAGI